MNRQISIAIALIVLMGSACKKRSFNATDKAAVKMAGGQTVAQMDPLNGFIVALTDGNGESFCSGFLISPSQILSAAHCDVGAELIVGSGPIWAVFGYNVDTDFGRPQKNNFRARQIKKRVSHSAFILRDRMNDGIFGRKIRYSEPVNDIALFTLSDDLPIGSEPVEISGINVPLKVGDRVIAAGYGPTREQTDRSAPLKKHERAGILRKAELKVFSINEDAQEILTETPMFRKRGGCFGDSGGPLLATRKDGVIEAFGVLSGGECDADGSKTAFTYASAFLEWIEKNKGITMHSRFEDYCLAKAEVSESMKKTIDALLKIAGTTNCQQASEALEKRAEIDLQNMDLSNIWPLSRFRFSVQKINISGNKIKDVTPLKYLEKVNTIDLRGNPVENMQVLQKLKNTTILQ